MGQDERFLENIITGDETWCFFSYPVSKRQIAEWARQNSLKPNKPQLQKSQVKAMLIVSLTQKV